MARSGFLFRSRTARPVDERAPAVDEMLRNRDGSLGTRELELVVRVAGRLPTQGGGAG